MLKTSGYRYEIEEVLASHPAVMEVGVAPDPLKGEVPKAWVILRSGQSATESELRALPRATSRIKCLSRLNSGKSCRNDGRKGLRRLLVEETKRAS